MAKQAKSKVQTTVECPHCGADIELLDLFSVETQVIGEEANCTECDRPVVIDKVDPVVLLALDDEDDEDEEDGEEDSADFDDEDDDDDYEDDEDDDDEED